VIHGGHVFSSPAMAQVRRSSAFREHCFDGVGLWWRHRCPGWFRVNVRSISLVLPFCRCFHQFVLVVAAFIAFFCLSRSVLQKNIGLVGRFKKMFRKNWTIRQYTVLDWFIAHLTWLEKRHAAQVDPNVSCTDCAECGITISECSVNPMFQCV
jgi:hypothetical protein